MKPIKQTVYLPVEVEDITKHPNITLVDIRGIDTFCSEQEAFVFTPEQLNELLSEVIKQTLETAVDRAVVNDYDEHKQYSPHLDEKSITNTFETIFNKFKV